MSSQQRDPRAREMIDAFIVTREVTKRMVKQMEEALMSTPFDSSASEDALDKIAEACGCEAWDYPEQVVRDVREAIGRLNAKCEAYAKEIYDLKSKLLKANAPAESKISAGVSSDGRGEQHATHEASVNGKVHELKCWAYLFDEVEAGRKTFELRKDDRGFQRGDILVLMRCNPNHPHELWTRIDGRSAAFHSEPPATLRVRVTYVTHSTRMGVAEGWCCMGIQRIRKRGSSRKRGRRARGTEA